MVGLLMWKPPGESGREKVERRSILGVPFATVFVEKRGRGPEAFLRRRVRSAAKRLRRMGIQEVILPRDFPFATLVEETGLRQVSVRPLAQLMASEMVDAGLEEMGITGSCVEIAVAAGGLSGAVVRTVTELCLRYRYVTLSVPSGGGALAEQLRREYGVALRLEEPGKRAAAAVYFDPGLPGAEPPVCLRLWEESLPSEVLLPPSLEERLPQQPDRNRLLAALLRAGAVAPGQLRAARRGCGNLKKVYDLSEIAALDNSQGRPYNTKL